MAHPLKFAAALAASVLVATPSLAAGVRDVADRLYAALDDPSVPLNSIAALIADDYVDHDRDPSVPADLSDKEAIVELFGALRTGFSDMDHRLDMVEEIGTDRIVVYWTFTGTHDGPLFGIPASGKKVRMNGIDILKIEDGLITGQWHVEELASLFQQLGAGQ